MGISSFRFLKISSLLCFLSCLQLCALHWDKHLFTVFKKDEEKGKLCFRSTAQTSVLCVIWFWISIHPWICAQKRNRFSKGSVAWSAIVSWHKLLNPFKMRLHIAQTWTNTNGNASSRNIEGFILKWKYFHERKQHITSVLHLFTRAGRVCIRRSSFSVHSFFTFWIREKIFTATSSSMNDVKALNIMWSLFVFRLRLRLRLPHALFIVLMIFISFHFPHSTPLSHCAGWNDIHACAASSRDNQIRNEDPTKRNRRKRSSLGVDPVALQAPPSKALLAWD